MADLVIHDAQFTFNEYPCKIGWGHSTVEYAVAMSREAKVARLALTHHDPLRTDAAIEEIVGIARNEQNDRLPTLDIFAAAEGQSLTLRPQERRVAGNAATTLNTPSLASPLLLMAVSDPSTANKIREAAQADGITIFEAGSITEALNTAQSVQPSLVILEIESDEVDAVEDHTWTHRLGKLPALDIPILIVADKENAARQAVVEGWLIKPFSSAYVRTRIRACLLRTVCRWERVLTSRNEEQRLAILHGLRILDTPREERFDRITRLAASIFNVPMALIILVDRERQWFKSTYGLDESETSREVSFCTHAVASEKVLVVPDTFQDPRFADNPLVTEAPRIRFYAGCPIFAGANCIGTVCVLDNRPREVDTDMIGLLHDLAALAEIELQKTQPTKN
jgi:DNA-binding response OmpR family regulator